MNRPFWSFRSASSDSLCDSIEPLLSAYADGMASPAETRRIEAHLPACEGCRAALSWMQATRTALAARPVAVPPPDLHSRIALAIAASSPAPVTLRPARVFTVRAAYTAAASVTVLGIALSYGLRHTLNEVAINHPAKPEVIATVPPPTVKPQIAPKTPVRPLVASNTMKPLRRAAIVHKTVPTAVVPLEHTASNAPSAKLPVVPQAAAPVHHAPPTQKVASREIVPTEKHGIEKRSPLPTLKTAAPKLPDTLKVAKIIKEPIHVPVDIQPTRITPDQPTVQTASAHQPPAGYDDPLGGLKTQLREKNARVRDVALTAFSAPARGSFHEAMRGIQEIGNTDQTAVLGDIHGNQ